MSYEENIIELLKRQHAKGLAKYGETLEQNVTLSRIQRIEHIEEELIDALMYAEHIKAVVEDGLTANDYQRMAMRTASGMTSEETGVENVLLVNGVMGLNGEAGECIDIVKKHLFQGHELEREHLIEELGDCAWYLAVTCEALGITLGECLRLNVDKLAARYPDGFDKARSINRSGEKTYTLKEVIEELGVEIEVEKPKKRKTFLEDFLKKNPDKTAKEVLETRCVEGYYPITVDCTYGCHACWKSVMPEDVENN